MFEHNMVQITNAKGKTVAARVDGNTLHLLAMPLYDIALEAANNGQRLPEVAKKYATDEMLDYDQAIREQRLCSPITHPDPMHWVLTGTGLTHLGSAAPRNKMHQQSSEAQQVHEETETDTQKMFQLGVDGGKPGEGEVGVQPEWFYKGTGHILKAPYQ
ncbi:MAG TPA: FAH family protein, partial [Halomonas sp.]|nr:FAH family protein [Halomonas sp.]